MSMLFDQFEEEEILIEVTKLMDKLRDLVPAGDEDSDDVDDERLHKKVKTEKRESLHVDFDSSFSYGEVLFIRMAYEYTRITKSDRSNDFKEAMEEQLPDFETYSKIFKIILEDCKERAVLGEWVKFSLQMSIKEELTRRALINLFFNFIGEVKYSFRDYRTVLSNHRNAIHAQFYSHVDRLHVKHNPDAAYEMVNEFSATRAEHWDRLAQMLIAE